MVAKKLYFMEMVVNYTMTHLFQLAERVCLMYPSLVDESATPAIPESKPVVKAKTKPIRFELEDRMVEGNLF